MKQALRIIFAGSPGFAVPALEALMHSEHRVVAVYTQPDRPAGRGQNLHTSDVKQAAIRHDLPVLQPHSFSEPGAFTALEQIKADLMVVVAYGLILPQAVLDTPRYGCWNIHASLLPRWRGAAPIQRAIIAADQYTGISIMQMEAGLDTGPVLSSRKIPIEPSDTGGSLHDRLAALGAETLLNCIDLLVGGEALEPTVQDADQACYAKKLSKQEAAINWTEPASLIERKIRAFNPWPVAWTELDGQRLRVWSADVVNPGGGKPGEIVSMQPNGIEIGCGEGSLRITQLQKPGGKRISAADYLNARR